MSCYAALIGISLPTFRDSCSEISVNKHQRTQHNNQEERRPHYTCLLKYILKDFCFSNITIGYRKYRALPCNIFSHCGIVDEAAQSSVV